MNTITITLTLALVIRLTPAVAQQQKCSPVDFSKVTISDKFWRPRLERHLSATLPVCIDQIENKTGRILNFRNAAAGATTHSGIYFDDSDVYKAMEGMAYSLINKRDAAIEQKLDTWTALIESAQQPDGYFKTREREISAITRHSAPDGQHPSPDTRPFSQALQLWLFRQYRILNAALQLDLFSFFQCF